MGKLARLLRRSHAVLDGGFSTHCETKGANINVGNLWSARLICDEPNIIKAVHTDFLKAGANVITTATYQATVRGFSAERGMRYKEVERVFAAAVDIAADAAEEFSQIRQADGRDNDRALVGISIGPYGGYLGDGSEYTGHYGLDGSMDLTSLMDFHREQVRICASLTRGDFLLFETIPCALEGEAIAMLMQSEFPSLCCGIAFCCEDGSRLRSGESLADAVKKVAQCPQVDAIGVNCTAPKNVPSLLKIIRSVTPKALMAYANSGETYDASEGGWHGSSASPEYYGHESEKWIRCAQPSNAAEGHLLVGGCCRTTPTHIRRVSQTVKHLGRSKL